MAKPILANPVARHALSIGGSKQLIVYANQEPVNTLRRQANTVVRLTVVTTFGLIGTVATAGADPALVGGRYELAGTPVVPLPHPSGASGWLNDPQNRERLDCATALVREELATL
jgi:hypothetical protein